MTARARTAWVVAGLLLVAAGVLTAASHLTFWWPCLDAGAASELCAARADAWTSPPFMADPPDRLPWVTGPAAVASLLAGLSWAVLTVALPLGRLRRVLSLLVAVLTVSIGVWSVLSAFTPLIDPELPVPRLWWIGAELVAGLLVLAMLYRSADEPTFPTDLAWPVIALVGATTFGMLRWCAELLAFGGHLGEGVPHPYAGLGLAATLLLSGGALCLRGWLLRPRRSASSSRAVGRSTAPRLDATHREGSAP